MSSLSTVDVVWVLTSAALVFMMQAGFCCLESGYVRSKNSVNVAAKNFADFCISAGIFWAVGFGLMFGASENGIVGGTNFVFSVSDDPSHIAFFVFQLMFCGTATTIVSGAVAERTSYVAYLMIAVVISLIIYPVFGHWAWGGADGGRPGWLSELGFVDFAGSTVVHSVAGWVGLAAVIIIGPREGRFDGTGGQFRSHSLPLSALGVFTIWVGWIGFNGGSTLAANDAVPLIVFNTLIAGAFGGLASIIIAPLVFGRSDVPSMLNGALAGLVAITAPAHAVMPWSAVVIGLVGGVLCIVGTYLLERLRVDDVLSAFPVHAVAGIWGTLSVAFFGRPEVLGTGLGRVDQFLVQGAGVLVAMVWAFGLGFILLKLIDRVYPLRVKLNAERVGLNISEHDQSTEQLDLLRAMEFQRVTSDYSKPIPVEPNSETGDIAAQYNRVLQNLYNAKLDADTANNAKSDFLASMSHELRTPLNAIMGFSEVISNQYFGPIGSAKYKDYANDIMSSGRHLLSLVNDILDLSKIEAGRNTLVKTQISPRDAFDEALKIAKNAIDCSQIYFETRVADSVPPLFVDERAIKQVLLNLLFNAVKFTPGGGHVTLKATYTNGVHVLEVADSGDGIEPEDLKKITEPFAQLQANPHIAKMGTGLGLAIAKALVEAHGGTLRISSVVGKGTTVRVILPSEQNLVAD
ncbi:MAG: ammonium transporter [Rhodospirillales bacterium]|nr:ammonium transporter [Rhodospirillales bacterium]